MRAWTVAFEEHALARRLSVDRILVVGVETVVGANLAACLAEQWPNARVQCLTAVEGIAIPGCETRTGLPSGNAIAELCSETAAEHIVYCGSAARSSWELSAADIGTDLPRDAGAWAAAARANGSRFTFISSDAVFTGPWMFHDEEGPGQCASPAAQLIRQAEQQVLEACPEALVARTNAFGWSPLGESGWIEQRLAELKKRRLADQDFVRHATPILATDLAGILQRSWSEGLSGIVHIAGAERVSPLRFVQRLAEQYQLPWLSLCRSDALQECAAGFGAGECSLQTKRIRKAVCVAMPMISEGLAKLVEQDQSGYRARLCGERRGQQSRAA
jgi:dTDP-4-dehydrorhamnose reductase